MKRTRQQVVESLLGKIVKRPDFPTFSEHFSQVMKIAADDETSLRQITNIILRDFGLTLKLLRTANSTYYNRSGKPILTVTHAVSLLGLDAIRDVASGLLLFQHFRRKSAGLCELMLLSVLSASHARETAKQIEYPRIEEAYLCGMFRNLGEVLIAGYLPRKYAAVLARMKALGLTERTACLRVIECSYEDMGRAAARTWKMPDRVRLCMKAEHSRYAKTFKSELEVLEAVTMFSHGLTEAVYRQDESLIRGRMNELVLKHGPVLGVGRDQIEVIVRKGLEDSKSTFAMLKVPLDELRLRKQTEAALAALDSPEDLEIQGTEEVVLEPGADMLEQLTEEVELTVCSGGASDINRLMLIILETVYRGGGFHRVLFGLVTPDRSWVRGKLGLGEDIDEFLDEFSFPLSIRAGPVANVLLGKQDLYINDGRYNRSEFGRITKTASFGILPVCSDAVALGCLYFDRGKDPAPVSEDMRFLISRLRNLAGEAIGLSRKPAAVVS
jgi:HD-like signal output (HDOD) protein